MNSKSTDAVFSLIQTMSKGEKRHFMLLSQRQQRQGGQPLYVELFKELDRQSEYSEAKLLQRCPRIRKRQLANLKRHLYEQLLVSLRLVNSNQHLDVEIRELISRARILFHKGLYEQAQQIIDTALEKATYVHHDRLVLEIIEFEKLIESRYLIYGRDNQVHRLSEEAEKRSLIIARTGRLSNLSLRFYRLYLQIGHIRSEVDLGDLAEAYQSEAALINKEELTFYEKLYFFQMHVWYHHLKLNFPLSYRYAKKWLSLYEEVPHLRLYDLDSYLMGEEQLLTALLNIGDAPQLKLRLENLIAFQAENEAFFTFHHRVRAFLSISLARIHLHYLEGTFSTGTREVAEMETTLDQFGNQLDLNQLLLFQYKFACLYFGAGDFDTALDYLNAIINRRAGMVREDIQCYARILHLIAHYEKGHVDLLDYLVKSVYRFVLKMENQNPVLEAVLAFLRKELYNEPKTLVPAFQRLRSKLEEVSDDPYARRAFLYLDIRAWLASKIEGTTVEAVIKKRNAIKSSRAPSPLS